MGAPCGVELEAMPVGPMRDLFATLRVAVTSEAEAGSIEVARRLSLLDKGTSGIQMEPRAGESARLGNR